MRQIDKRNFPIRKRILTECIVSLILGALLLTGCEKKQEEATSGRKSELLIVENSDGEQSQGFVLEDDGDIIVPADFVGDDKEVKLTLPDGTKTTATVWSRNPESNVAVLSVSNPSALTSSGVQPVTVSQTQASVNSSEYVYILHTVNGQEVKSQARVVERGQKNGTEYILADMNSSRA